ncbi:MAG: hypothetical protein MJ197_04095 [Bacteroidales bacterium]|nr:hypothetical protein [Bacteroidales bacterium]
MKHFITLLIIMSCFCYAVFCQTVTITSNTNLDKLIIEENTTIINTAKITIADSLIVYGTLINNGIIYSKQALVSGGTITSNKKDSIKIENNLILANAYITSTDSINSVNITASNIFVENYTTIESAYLTTNDLIINDTLEFTGKIGVKTVLNDFIVNGHFKNTDNENIILYGNAINNSASPCTNANFELWGNNKTFIGEFSCYRIDLENTTSLYTNQGSLTITTSFSGKGTLIQGENSYLEIKTTTSPNIIAQAEGNTVSYTRGGNQTVNCSEFQNLIVSKDRPSSIILSKNTTVHNSVQINKKAFIDCETYELHIEKSLSQQTENIIPVSTNGIFLKNGKITIDIEAGQNILIPLLTNDTTIANIAIQNIEEETKLFTIDSLFNYTTYSGTSNDEKIEQEFIQTTWHIQSDASRAIINCFWDTKNELPYFYPDSSTLYQSIGNGWKHLAKTSQKQLVTQNINGYFTIGNNISFLPISIYDLAIQKTSNGIDFYWKSDLHKTITLEKSNNGISFYTVTEITTTNGIYKYIDNNITNDIMYYRFSTTNNNGHIEYSNIYPITIENEPTIIIDKSSNTISIKQIENYIITIYNLNGTIICKSINHPILLPNIPHGIYNILIENDHNKFTQKIAW